MTGLVYIGRVVEISPINGADRISAAKVVCGRGGIWSGVVQRGQFSVGELCEVYLQDAVLPHTERFVFMEKHGYRVRMARFLNVPSECLIMPLSILGDVGDDVTDAAGVTKYEKPLPVSMGGEIAGHFPQFIPKTDEVNFQSVPDMVTALHGLSWYATVKYDGTSTTMYRRGDHVGICSRNYEIKHSDDNVMWATAKRYGLHESIPDGLALQWETYGPGIQGNPLGVSKPDMALFNVYDIASGLYLNWGGVRDIAEKLAIPAVELAATGETFDMNADGLRKLAEGVYPNGKQREGVVVRPLQEKTVVIDKTPMRLSFKAVNLLYRD